jgi:hypothetical protein
MSFVQAYVVSIPSYISHAPSLPGSGDSLQFDNPVAKGEAFGLDGFGDFGHNRFALCKMDEGRRKM